MLASIDKNISYKNLAILILRYTFISISFTLGHIEMVQTSNVHAYIANMFSTFLTDIQGNTTGASGDNLFINQLLVN